MRAGRQETKKTVKETQDGKTTNNYTKDEANTRSKKLSRWPLELKWEQQFRTKSPWPSKASTLHRTKLRSSNSGQTDMSFTHNKPGRVVELKRK